MGLGHIGMNEGLYISLAFFVVVMGLFVLLVIHLIKKQDRIDAQKKQAKTCACKEENHPAL
ncbi:hypothetical protein JKG47_10075 [Acidithiobacillus sp. MC6.1]|nr:hypothetical protein [Acidithiobacillus sp. MC6.1]